MFIFLIGFWWMNKHREECLLIVSAEKKFENAQILFVMKLSFVLSGRVCRLVCGIQNVRNSSTPSGC